MPAFFPGYIAPTGAAPLEGTALQDFLQQVLVGITGLSGKLVRPRWQAEPPNIPEAGECWCAFGINERFKDTNAYVWQNPGALNAGVTGLQRQEELHLLASFYDTGSNGQADKYAELLCDGFQIPQNREVLDANGYALVNTGQPTPVPSLLKLRWLYRVDVPVIIRRQIDRTYSVPNIQSADAELITDNPPTTTDITVTQTSKPPYAGE